MQPPRLRKCRCKARHFVPIHLLHTPPNTIPIYAQRGTPVQSDALRNVPALYIKLLTIIKTCITQPGPYYMLRRAFAQGPTFVRTATDTKHFRDAPATVPSASRITMHTHLLSHIRTQMTPKYNAVTTPHAVQLTPSLQTLTFFTRARAPYIRNLKHTRSCS